MDFVKTKLFVEYARKHNKINRKFHRKEGNFCDETRKAPKKHIEHLEQCKHKNIKKVNYKPKEYLEKQTKMPENTYKVL